MGKNNRQRRAERHRQRERARARARSQDTDVVDRRDLVEMLVFEAGEAAELGETEALDAIVGRLGRFGGLAGPALTGALVQGLRAAWDGGWQPADIARAAAKRLGTDHDDLTAELITLEAQTSAGPGNGMPEEWARQLRDLDRPPRADGERWSTAASVKMGAGLLGMLMHLPVVPHLLPPPKDWGRVQRTARAAGVDGRVLDKVRALLAKAESTEFEEEAMALTAKAQEFMARYSIDRAMIEGPGTHEAPCGRRLGVDDPYAQAKASLLGNIARANRCDSVWMSSYGFSTVLGFPGDLDIVELLYMSLLVQATRAMVMAGSVRDGSGRSRTRSFRQSFLFAFAIRIGERLRAATQTATDEASQVHGASLLPVLAGRSAAIEDLFTTMFPSVTSTSMRVTNAAGWAAGRAAADLAHLGPDQQLPAGVAV